MQKILFYNHTGQVSGAEKVLLSILAGLDRSRFQPVLMCPANGPLAAAAAQLGVETLAAPELRARFTWRPDFLLLYLWSFIKASKEQRRLVRGLAPDLLHANSVRAGLVATAATIGLSAPVVWHIHDLLPRHPFSAAIRLVAALSGRARILAVSQAAANRFNGWLLTLLRRRRTQAVIRNAVDTSLFRPLPEARAKVRQSLGLSEDAFVFGSLGQITARKGQSELLQAFAGAQRELPQAHLVIAGAPLFNQDHLYLEDLRRAADEAGLAGCVHFLGARRDVAELLAAFDVFVLNSASEAFSLVILEALACGTPVLATAVGGTPEVIIDQVTGWLVNAGDITELTRTLREAYENAELRAQFSARTPGLMRQDFTPSAYLRALTQFYDKCLKERLVASVAKTALMRTKSDAL